MLSLLVISIISIALYLEIWCNGSTTDFGSVSTGSNPVISTNSSIDINFDTVVKQY